MIHHTDTCRSRWADWLGLGDPPGRHDAYMNSWHDTCDLGCVDDQGRPAPHFGTPGTWCAVCQAFHQTNHEAREHALDPGVLVLPRIVVEPDHDCADAFPTVSVPRGRTIAVHFPLDGEVESILLVPVDPATVPRNARTGKGVVW